LEGREKILTYRTMEHLTVEAIKAIILWMVMVLALQNKEEDGKELTNIVSAIALL
jgi:hypothetical protein